MKTAYLGNKYSHTFEACRTLCDASDALIGFKTVRQAAKSVADGECDACVIPLENSVEGTVTATADALLEMPLYITAETALSIHHSLIVREGGSLSGIKRVYSHPQALAQCREWLEKNLPDAEQTAVYSTAYALELLDFDDKAAIAGAAASGQKVLSANIEDYPSNKTRFVRLSRGRADGGARASVIFAAKNRPGGLLSVLKVFEVCGMNMTYIQSRPSKNELGDYIFFVDFTLPKERKAQSLERLLTLLDDWTGFCKFLGSYDHINSEVI